MKLTPKEQERFAKENEARQNRKESEIYKRISEIEIDTSRYYCLDTDHDAPNSLVKSFIEAVGKMGEAHSMLNKLMDDIENGKV